MLQALDFDVPEDSRTAVCCNWRQRRTRRVPARSIEVLAMKRSVPGCSVCLDAIEARQPGRIR
jgi:hypothetical protein